MKRSLIAVLCGLVVLSVAPAAGSAHVFTIRGDWKIGSFLVKRDGTLAGAIEAFGTPGYRDRDGSSCVVRWVRHGLKIVFYNLGGQNPCRPAYGFFSRARARGPHWQTGKGLEIGDRQRRLRNLYPNAEFRPFPKPAGWWLVRRRIPFGGGGSYPGLLAKMENRHVAAFHVRYPAGGE